MFNNYFPHSLKLYLKQSSSRENLNNKNFDELYDHCPISNRKYLTEMFENHLHISPTDYFKFWVPSYYAENHDFSDIHLTNVDKVSEGAFINCSIDNLYLDKIVDSFESECFNNKYGSSIKSIYYNGDICDWCNGWFETSGSNPITQTSNFYMNDQLVDNLTIPKKCVLIPSYGFIGYSGLHKVFMNEGVSSIGGKAFFECNNLEEVYLPQSITTIKSHAFAQCPNLTKIIYSGTKEQWEDVDRMTSWKESTPCIIICTDGEVSL
jgi:hypothetical protein